MSLTLYLHPLASFCQKVLIALYESGTPFKSRLVDLMDPAERESFAALWPVAKMPVLRDEARNETVPETSIIIEYLDRHHPGRARMIPEDPELALSTRLHDRLYDLYVQEPMQKIVADRLRPAGRKDVDGVAQARGLLRTTYAMLDRRMADRTWAVGETFTMADCAAAPALFYADKVEPFDPAQKHLAAYSERLKARPSFARVIEEAKPYFHLFPATDRASS